MGRREVAAPPNATRKDLRAIIARQQEEIKDLREQAEVAQEVGLREGLFDAEEALLPWQSEEDLPRLRELEMAP